MFIQSPPNTIDHAMALKPQLDHWLEVHELNFWVEMTILTDWDLTVEQQ